MLTQGSALPGSSARRLEIPTLRIVPTASLVLHEHADRKRVLRLEARLRTDGFMKNPPIVAPIPGTERYVVLDGANRTSAIVLLGCRDILVQVVDYKSAQVRLLTWHHLITGREPAQFLEEIGAVEGIVVREAPIEDARAVLAERGVLAYIAVPSGANTGGTRTYVVDGAPGTDHHATLGATALLNAMVDTYKSDPLVSIHRSNTDVLGDLLQYYDGISGLVVFPSYTPDDILVLAEAGNKVPTGITRHIINPRALRINVPIEVFMSGDTLEEKNAWWHEQLKKKLAANEVRLYEESTYLFDE